MAIKEGKAIEPVIDPGNDEKKELKNGNAGSLLSKIIKALGYHQRFFWTTLWLCFGFVIILISLFCADRNKIHLPPALLCAFACLVIQDKVPNLTFDFHLIY